MRSRFFTCNIGLIIPIQSYLITVKTLWGGIWDPQNDSLKRICS
jgi:hypothetical protein